MSRDKNTYEDKFYKCKSIMILHVNTKFKKELEDQLCSKKKLRYKKITCKNSESQNVIQIKGW